MVTATATNAMPRELEQLGLTDAQRGELRVALTRGRDRVLSVVRSFDPAMKAAMGTTEIEIGAVLTAAQRAALAAYRREHPQFIDERVIKGPDGKQIPFSALSCAAENVIPRSVSDEGSSCDTRGSAGYEHVRRRSLAVAWDDKCGLNPEADLSSFAVCSPSAGGRKPDARTLRSSAFSAVELCRPPHCACYAAAMSFAYTPLYRLTSLRSRSSSGMWRGKKAILPEELLVVADREHRPVPATPRQLLHRRDERASHTHPLRIRRNRERAQLREARRIFIEMRAADHAPTTRRDDEMVDVRRDELLAAWEQSPISDVEVDQRTNGGGVPLGSAADFHGRR